MFPLQRTGTYLVIIEEGEVDPDGGQNVTPSQPSHGQHADLDMFIRTYKKIRDNETHHELQEDLVEHLWLGLDEMLIACRLARFVVSLARIGSFEIFHELS